MRKVCAAPTARQWSAGRVHNIGANDEESCNARCREKLPTRGARAHIDVLAFILTREDDDPERGAQGAKISRRRSRTEPMLRPLMALGREGSARRAAPASGALPVRPSILGASVLLLPPRAGQHEGNGGATWWRLDRTPAAVQQYVVQHWHVHGWIGLPSSEGWAQVALPYLQRTAGATPCILRMQTVTRERPGRLPPSSAMRTVSLRAPSANFWRWLPACVVQNSSEGKSSVGAPMPPCSGR